MNDCLPRLAIAGLLLCAGGAATAQMSRHHSGRAGPGCPDANLACATQVTPAFAADGTLWLAYAANGFVSVVHSADLGRTFSTPVAVNPDPLDLDWGPDSRPNIAIDKDGRVFVAFARFKDRKYDGQVLIARSTDGGRSFSPPAPITPDPASQRFQALALDADGALFAAWIDKRDRVAAAARHQDYAGAALAFTWSKDHGASFSTARIARDNTCECCRLALAFAAPGRPVIAFRNVFGGTVRDHAVITFRDPATPGALRRVSIDDWHTDICPHQGPSLAISADGSYHIAWFTNGHLRQGLFFASSTDRGKSFSQPMPVGNPGRNPSRPFALAVHNALWLAWKEFDGKKTSIVVMTSRDNGRSWSPARTVAQTGDASDHPLLVARGHDVFLSWKTRLEGYRLLPLAGAS